MRRIGWTDVHAAACVLGGLPVWARANAVDRMLTCAAAADAYRLRFGKAHPEWGNGSLFGMLRMAHDGFAEPDFSDPDYQQCVSEVLSALGRRHPYAQAKQVGMVGSGGGL